MAERRGAARPARSTRTRRAGGPRRDAAARARPRTSRSPSAGRTTHAAAPGAGAPSWPRARSAPASRARRAARRSRRPLLLACLRRTPAPAASLRTTSAAPGTYGTRDPGRTTLGRWPMSRVELAPSYRASQVRPASCGTMRGATAPTAGSAKCGSSASQPARARHAVGVEERHQRRLAAARPVFLAAAGPAVDRPPQYRGPATVAALGPRPDRGSRRPPRSPARLRQPGQAAGQFGGPGRGPGRPP